MIFRIISVLVLFNICNHLAQQTEKVYLSEADTALSPPYGLLCELLRYPEKAVITDSSPEFSWIFPSSGIKQTAYRILVSSAKQLLCEGKTDFWDSGIIKSNQSINNSYNGNPLSSNSFYWWKVKVWDQENKESDYSEPQQYRTSNLGKLKEDWPGKSEFVMLPSGEWVSENRQTSDFTLRLPRDIVKVDDGRWFCDFGKASFGTLEINATSQKENDSIIVYLGERKNDDLTVNKNPGRSNIGFHKLKLILKEGSHKYKIVIPPHHSRAPNTQKLAPFYLEVLPFRYVEIIGDPNNTRIENVNQLALYYPFDENSSNFFCSDTNLNKVWDLCKYTLKATPFLGLYADGNRERMPYEADAFIQQLGHYCVDREFAIGRYTTNFLLYNPSWPTEWNMHIILMAWHDYMNTGNIEFIQKYYQEIKEKTLLSLAMENNLISTTKGKMTADFLRSINFKGNGLRDIVDWPRGTLVGQEQASNAGPTPEGERDGFVFKDFNTVVNAFHYRTLMIMTKFAEIMNIEDDKQFFIKRAAEVKESFLSNFFDYDRKIFIDGIGTHHSSLHANMFALAFNLVPKDYVNSVIEFIKGKGMACSVYGSQYLLEALFNYGESDYAISLMTSKSKRSWINMINVGSTMTTEAWDEYYKPNLTWNHAWGSAPANIIPRKLVGIEPIESGFSKFRIVPQPGNLRDIELKLPTIRGSINFELANNEKNWSIDISVPGNSEGELYLPDRFEKILVNSKVWTPSRSEFKAGQKFNVIILKSGKYTIFAEQ